MTLNIISDLHCDYDFDHISNDQVEWYGFHPEKLEPADYLIIAGDIGYAPTENLIVEDLKKRTEGKFKNVLWIRGNHSYWVPYDEKSDKIPETYFHKMVPDQKIDVVDGDVAIIGTTMWTNRTTFSELRMMNDYRHTPELNAGVKERLFAEQSQWLREKCTEYKSKGLKVVIVTHHNPRDAYEMPEMSGEHEEVWSSYWVWQGAVNDIRPDIWICGHIHEDFDAVIDGVRYIRHPIGYRFTGFYSYINKEKPEWYNKVIEV